MSYYNYRSTFRGSEYIRGNQHRGRASYRRPRYEGRYIRGALQNRPPLEQSTEVAAANPYLNANQPKRTEAKASVTNEVGHCFQNSKPRSIIENLTRVMNGTRDPAEVISLLIDYMKNTTKAKEAELRVACLQMAKESLKHPIRAEIAGNMILVIQNKFGNILTIEKIIRFCEELTPCQCMGSWTVYASGMEAVNAIILMIQLYIKEPVDYRKLKYNIIDLSLFILEFGNEDAKQRWRVCLASYVDRIFADRKQDLDELDDICSADVGKPERDLQVIATTSQQ